MRTIRFKVSPYALFDSLFALENTKDNHRHIEYTVTKEDDEIWVYAGEIIHTSISVENCCSKQLLKE